MTLLPAVGTDYRPERRLGAPIALGGKGVEKRLAAGRKMVSWADCVVADIGCGNGAYTEAIAREARQVFGVDMQEEFLIPFRARTDQSSNHPRLACGAAESLPLAEASVDVAFCIETLEHVQDDQAALREILRILKPEGHALLTVPNKWFLFETHGLKSHLPGGNRTPFISWLPTFIHSRIADARIYTNGQIRTMLEDAGFVDVAVDYVMPPLDKVEPAPLRGLLRQIIAIAEGSPLRRFGVSLVVSGRKPAPV